jgi:hypothetical protein
VAEFLQWKGIDVWYHKDPTSWNYKLKSHSVMYAMLKSSLYAWYIDLPEWEINKVKWKQKALISLETHKKILRRIREIWVQKGLVTDKMEINRNRIDRNNDFPLRWALYCENSKTMLTWWWSRGRHWDRFPYYMYSNKSPMRNKSISRDKLHQEFDELLQNVLADERLIQVFQFNLQQQIIWSWKNKDVILSSLKSNLSSAENKIQRYVERIWKTEDEDLISNYESELKKLHTEKEEILDKIKEEKNRVWNPNKINFEEIKNALHMWRKWNLDSKKKLISNMFPEWLPVTLERHLWTPKLSLPYRILEAGKSDESKMVELIWQNLNLLS